MTQNIQSRKIYNEIENNWKFQGSRQKILPARKGQNSSDPISHHLCQPAGRRAITEDILFQKIIKICHTAAATMTATDDRGGILSNGRLRGAFLSQGRSFLLYPPIDRSRYQSAKFRNANHHPVHDRGWLCGTTLQYPRGATRKIKPPWYTCRRKSYFFCPACLKWIDWRAGVLGRQQTTCRFSIGYQSVMHMMHWTCCW